MFSNWCFVQADRGLAGNIDETSGDNELRAFLLQVAISLLTSEQNFCYPT